MKIGVMVESFRLPLREGIKKAAELGAEGLQIHAVDGETAPENLSGKGRRELLGFVESLGLEVAAVCGDLGGHGFAVPGDNSRKIERTKRIIELANDMGTSIVTTHLGVIPEEKDTDSYKAIFDACSELGQFADTCNSSLAVETGPEPTKRLAEFVRSLPCDGIRVNYDPANLAMVIGEDATKGVANVEGLIVHTHAKDGLMIKKTDPAIIYGFFADSGIEDMRLEDYFKEVPLGEGSVDFPEYIEALKQSGFDGFLTIERETGENPIEDISRAVEFLKGALDG